MTVRGSAVLADKQRVCHPDSGMDCYRLTTIYDHPTPCKPCREANLLLRLNEPRLAVLAASTAVTGQDERAGWPYCEGCGRPVDCGRCGPESTESHYCNDCLAGAAAPATAVTAAEDDGRERCERCGEVIPAGRSECPADAPAPVVAAIPADPNSED